MSSVHVSDGVAPRHRRSGRFRRSLAALVVFAVVGAGAPTMTAPPASAGLLEDLLAPVVGRVLGLLEGTLRPVTGLVSDLTGLPVDDAVDDLVTESVEGLVGTLDRLVLDDDGAPLGPPGLDDITALVPLEAADTLVEDVVYPGVIEPTGPVVGPVLGTVGALTAPLGLPELLDTTIGLVRDAALAPLDLDPAAYVIHAVTPQGETVRDALIDVPLPIDVTDDGADDVLVELRIITARPSLRVTRLPSAPAHLPLAIDAVVAPDGHDAPGRLSIGYDTLHSDAPGVFRATVADLGFDSGEIAAELHTASPGPSLTLTAGLYAQGADGTRVNPTDIRLGFTPVPTDASVTAQGLTGGGSSGRVGVTVSEPSTVDAAVRTHQADATAEIGAVIDQVPGSVELGVSQVGDQGVALDYTASGPVSNIALRLVETQGGVTRRTTVGFEGVDATSAHFVVSADDLSYEASAPIDALTLEVIDPRGIVDRATVLRARLQGLPSSLGATLGDGGAIGLDAGAEELGLLELQLLSDPEDDLALAPGTDGILYRDVPDEFAAFLRVTRLRSVDLATAPDLAVSLRTAGGQPFVASIAQGDEDGVDEVSARLSALPADLVVSLAETAEGTALSYDGSVVVDLFEVEIVGPELSAALVVESLPTSVDAAFGNDGVSWAASEGVPLITAELASATAVFGRATELRARLTAVPAAFAISVGGSSVAVDAPGGIGLVEVLASDGTTELGVPEGIDGLLLVDTPDAYGAALRVTGLERIQLAPEPLVLALQTIGDRTFLVDITQQAAEGSGTEIRAEIDRLPSSVILAIDDGDGTPTLSYLASAPVESLRASVVSTGTDGGVTTIALEVDDLPAALTLAFGEESVTYAASAVVPRLRLEVTDPGGLLGRADRLLVELLDLPTAFTVGIAGDAVSFDAGVGTLGSFEALLTNGPEPALPDGIDGLLLRDTPTEFSAAIRLVGLQAITFDLSAATTMSLRTTGGRLFEIDVRQEAADGSRTEVRATLDRLPTEVSLSLGGALGGGDPTETLALAYQASTVMDELRAQFVSEPFGESPTTASVRITELPTDLSLGVQEDGAVAYTASSRVPVLELDLENPDGIFGDATLLRLRAADLPTGIVAAIDPEGGMTADTSGGALGHLEALFTSGDEIGLAGDVDGIVFRDTPALFAAFVRITGLHGIAFAPGEGGAQLSLDTDGGRTFEVDAFTVNEEESSTTAIAATLGPLPDSVDLDLADDPVTGLALSYSASAPMDRLFGDLEFVDPEGTTSFALEVLDLPTSVTLALDAESGAITYTGSDRVTKLSILGESPEGIFLTATTLQAVLEDLPHELEIGLGSEDTPGAISLDAKGGQLGLLEALATSGPNLGPAPGVDGVVLRDTADAFVLGMRVTNLRRAVVNPDPVEFTIGTAGGRTFVLDAVLDGGEVIELGEDAVDVQATFSVLPELVTLGFGLVGDQQALSIDASSTIGEVLFALVQTPEGASPLSAAVQIDEVPTSLDLAIDVQGAINYAASARVPRLSVTANDPAGLFARADDLSLVLTDLPLVLDVALSDTGSIVITTQGGRLGELEAAAYLHAPAALAAGIDGVVLEDLVDDYRVFARFTNIDSVDVAQIPQPRVKMQGAGGRPLSIGLYASAPGKASPIPNVAFTTASLSPAPPSVDLALLDGAPGTINVAYTASTTADLLQFQTNNGDRWITSATISNPVPRSFVACQTGNASCLPSPGINQSAANIGSFSFVADQHTTLSVLDCARPLNVNCTRQNGTQLTHVNNLRVKTFQFGGDIDQGTIQASGRLYANTVPPGLAYNSANADALSGEVFNRDGSTRLTFTFGSNFKAWDRYRRFDRFPSLPFFSTRIRESRGGISCTSGTNMSVTVNFIFDLTFNANSLLC